MDTIFWLQLLCFHYLVDGTELWSSYFDDSNGWTFNNDAHRSTHPNCPYDNQPCLSLDFGGDAVYDGISTEQYQNITISFSFYGQQMTSVSGDYCEISLSTDGNTFYYIWRYQDNSANSLQSTTVDLPVTANNKPSIDIKCSNTAFGENSFNYCYFDDIRLNAIAMASSNPSSNPTYYPTTNPTYFPSSQPSFFPTYHIYPSTNPSVFPSIKPTFTPSVNPSLLNHSISTTEHDDEPHSDKKGEDLLWVAIVIVIICVSVGIVLLLFAVKRYKNRQNPIQQSQVAQHAVFSTKQDKEYEKVSAVSMSNVLDKNTMIMKDGEDEVEQWLKNKCGLPQYYKNFVSNGYELLDIIKEIEDKSELEKIGIKLRGHRTKIWNEIKKLKRHETKDRNKVNKPATKGRNKPVTKGMMHVSPENDEIIIGDEQTPQLTQEGI